MYLIMLGSIQDMKTFMENMMSQIQVKRNHYLNKMNNLIHGGYFTK